MPVGRFRSTHRKSPAKCVIDFWSARGAQKSTARQPVAVGRRM
jgi:hypothetical protein